MKADLKCQNCGSTLSKIENEENTYVCLHCGSKQLIKEDNIINHIQQHITKHVYNGDDYDEYIKNAETLMALNEFEKALPVLEKATAAKPADYYGWWLMVVVKFKIHKAALDPTNFFNYLEIEQDIDSSYENAYKLASDKQKKEIETQYEEAKSDMLAHLDKCESYRSGHVAKSFGKTKKFVLPLFIKFSIFTILPLLLLAFDMVLLFLRHSLIDTIILISTFALLVTIALCFIIFKTPKYIIRGLDLKRVIKRNKIEYIDIIELTEATAKDASRYEELMTAKTVEYLISRGHLKNYILQNYVLIKRQPKNK